MENLYQVSSVSLLMTSSTALANEGLFELTLRPSLTRAVSWSFAETTEEPGLFQTRSIGWPLKGLGVASPDYQVGAHFEALDKGMLVAASKSIETFFCYFNFT